MNMDSEYIIHVTLTPWPEDNPNKPYFWMATRNDCNAGSSWSENPIKAIEEANNWYKYICVCVTILNKKYKKIKVR